MHLMYWSEVLNICLLTLPATKDSAPPARRVERYAVSAKIEAWDKPSLIAVANDHTRALLLAGSEEPAQYALMAVATFAPFYTCVSYILARNQTAGKGVEKLLPPP